LGCTHSGEALMEICRSCASSRISWAEYDGRTGVFAPDGGAEYQHQSGVRCLDCNAIEDGPDLTETEELEEEIMTTRALTTMHEAAQQQGLNRDQVQLLKDTICKGSTDEELRLFVEVCRHKNLDPFSKQIHPVKRWDSTLRCETMTFQTGIDGLRVIAERTGRYEGQTQPRWCGPDGKWREAWFDKNPPAAAMVGVYRAGFREPMFGIAIYSEFVQITKEGGPNSMWRKMPANQLLKCAEAQALRKAFPEELSALYSDEELGQAGTAQPLPAATTKVAEIPAAAYDEEASTPADAGDPADPEDEPAAASIKLRLEQFAKMREAMGDAGYYAILSAHGFAHANEIKQLSVARAIYREMRQTLDYQTTRGAV
jgi:phage recombination protein Bet